MSATRPREFSIQARAADGHGTGSAGARSNLRAPDTSDESAWAPPPLPSDPAAQAELRSMLEQGLQDARAGRGEDWETVHARLFGRLD